MFLNINERKIEYLKIFGNLATNKIRLSVFFSNKILKVSRISQFKVLKITYENEHILLFRNLKKNGDQGNSNL